jgi:hypothetical protein
MEAVGFKVFLCPLRGRSSCLGEHGKHYNPATIFKRWQRCFQKHHKHGRLTWIEPYARRLLHRYVVTGETLHLYAFLGALAGIVEASVPDREVDWREPNFVLERVQRYFPMKGAKAVRPDRKAFGASVNPGAMSHALRRLLPRRLFRFRWAELGKRVQSHL